MELKLFETVIFEEDLAKDLIANMVDKPFGGELAVYFNFFHKAPVDYKKKVKDLISELTGTLWYNKKQVKYIFTKTKEIDIYDYECLKLQVELI